MNRSLATFSLLAFVLGAASAIAAKKAFDPKAYYEGMDAPAAVEALLARAEVLAEGGSWERIAIARVRYLSGDKPKGQAMIDGVLKGKVATSDLYRIATIYALAEEWDKAKPLFEKAIAADPADDRSVMEAACWFNLNGDRVRAEQLFRAAYDESPDEVWHYIAAAGSFAGLKPF